MDKRCLNVAEAPPALGPYSHAVAAGGFLFLSGQGPFNRDGSGYTPASFETECRMTLENIKAVLDGCGSSLDHVVKTTVFLKDMGNFPAFNAIYGEYFGASKPARSTIQAAKLPLDIQVEMEAIAIVPGS